MKHIFSTIALIAITLCLPLQVNGNGSVRNVQLEATASAPSDDAWGMLKITQTPQDEEQELVIIGMNVSRLICRGPTFANIGRDTAPFEVYVLKVNDEPIVTFNTRCLFGGGANATSGEFTTTIPIQGYESFLGWLENPATDPIHAEVYLESPESDPLTSTLVLEGWQY